MLETPESNKARQKKNGAAESVATRQAAASPIFCAAKKRYRTTLIAG